MPERDQSIDDAARTIGHACMIKGLTVAVCESLTSGQIATNLGAVPEASEWFSGSLVAYRNQTTFDVLGIDEGPVVTAEAAERMAAGIRELTHADVAVSVTGVGGPGSEEGEDAGTVFIGVSAANGTLSFAHRFDGDPEEIVQRSVQTSLRHLQAAVLAA